MKKTLFVLFAVSALVFASCSKEIRPETTTSFDENAKTITFSASIDVPASTKATLDGLSVKWADGDVIGIVSDKGGAIKVYPVVPNATDATQCTFSIAPVVGATTYYALYTGSSDFSAITFDKATATFSGLNTSRSGFSTAAPTVSDLTMAGKTTTTSITMKPCLALVKLQISSESVAAVYAQNSETSKYYSGVRGLYLYQKNGSSNLYSSEDYSVDLSGASMVVTASATNYRDYKQINEGTSLMASAEPYYISIIPGGAITGLYITYLGFGGTNPDTDYVWDELYPMTLTKSATIDPGDFLDLGTLNPVGLKVAADKAAASFTPKITIDGSFDDWDGITEFANDNPVGSSSANRIAAWRATSDAQFIYLYFKIKSGKITSADYSYIYTGFDVDNDGAGTYTVPENVGGPCDVQLLMYPFVLGSNPVVCSSSENGHIKYAGAEVGKVNVYGAIDTDAYIEVSIPRNKIGSPASGTTINACHSYQGYTTGWHTFDLE